MARGNGGGRGAAVHGWSRTREKQRMLTTRPGMRAEGNLCAAMLTAGVNIAVFAAFHVVIGDTSRARAAFKPVCAIWQLDMWCYGWQKRQETARSGTVGGKNGTVLGHYRDVQARMESDARACGEHVCASYVGVQMRRELDGGMFIEPIYHQSRRLSRVTAGDCRDGGR
jgi:hypothetical protein